MTRAGMLDRMTACLGVCGGSPIIVVAYECGTLQPAKPCMWFHRMTQNQSSVMCRTYDDENLVDGGGSLLTNTHTHTKF